MDGFDRMTRQLVAAVQAEVLDGRSRPPEAGVTLWNAFAELSATRTLHERGPNRIAYHEMLAWSQLMRTPLEPRHVRVLRAMDDAWIAAVHDLAERTQGRGAAPPRPAGEISPEVFDAIFG